MLVSYVDKQCEAEVVKEGERNYQRCTREASRISHAGWFMCEWHASPRDLTFADPESKGNWERRQEYASGFPARASWVDMFCVPIHY